MNLAKYSLDNTKIVYFFLAVLLIGGILSFGRLGKKEDAPFVIKSAVIMTRYPGAEPAEVERLVTEPISRHSLPHPFRRSGTNCGVKCSTYSPNCPQALLYRPSRMILETFSASITAWWVTTVSLMKK